MKRDYPVSVEWKAFELRPGTPPQGIVRAPRPGDPEPGQPVTGHLGDMAQESGLVMRRAPVVPFTRPVFEAAEYAKAQGRFDEFHWAAFKAYWEDGKNLGDTAALKEIAYGSGLDPEGLKSCLETNQYTKTVEEQIEEAHHYGITGIPAFIIGKYLFMGAQPYEFFQKVVEQVQKEAASPPQE